MSQLPDIVGKSQADAITDIEAAGLTVGVTVRLLANYPSRTLQVINAALVGSSVDIVLSDGADLPAQTLLDVLNL